MAMTEVADLFVTIAFLVQSACSASGPVLRI